jgi:alkyldihydroxyacetonephosphate synthase
VTLFLDKSSQLARVDGTMTLGELEASLAAQGFTLDVEGAGASSERIDDWLASGARGTRDAWLDPADHLVAGLDARLRDGRALVVHPTPRRSVGPDLIAMVVGMAGRFATVERAWLRVHPLGVARPNVGALVGDRSPALTTDEARLLDLTRSALEEA